MALEHSSHKYTQWNLVSHGGTNMLVQAAYWVVLDSEKQRFPWSKQFLNLCTPDFKAGPAGIPSEDVELLPLTVLSDAIRERLAELGIRE